MWVEIISIAGVLVLLGLALALLCAYNIITELLYRLICKMTAHVVEPLKILPRWIITKIPPLAKLRDAAEDSLWSSAAVFIIVMVLFLASLAYLLFSAFSSGDFWTYIGDEFLFSLPSISFMALTLGTSADTEMAFLEIMTESTMIGLCLYHVNKYISDLEVAPKVFYNIVFTFIGWAISHLVSYYIFVPLVALFPIGQFIM